jgi:hypothetical protein
MKKLSRTKAPTPRSRRGGPRPTWLGYVALGLSILASGGIWWLLSESEWLYGADGSTFINPRVLLLFVSPVLLLVAIVLDVVAAVHGGPDRVAAVIGGLLILTVPIAVLFLLISYGL